MLFWIWIILTIVGTLLAFVNTGKWKLDDVLTTIGAILASVGIVATAIALVCLIICNTNIDGEIASMEKRYESLVYQYENNVYENDNDLGKRELMEDIQDWNENLASKQAGQDDFWLGIFIPDIYDQFEFIELK